MGTENPLVLWVKLKAQFTKGVGIALLNKRKEAETSNYFLSYTTLQLS